MERILIIINKSWEADAALAAMFNPEFKSAKKGFPEDYAKQYQDKTIQTIQKGGYPLRDGEQDEVQPRIIYIKGNLQVEVWCLNNIMAKPAGVDKNDSFYYSRSLQKALDFPKIIRYSNDPIKLIAAFGTAGLPSELSKNGGVIVGSSIFTYDSNKIDPAHHYSNPKFGQVIKSTIDRKFFDNLNLAMSDAALKVYFEGAALSTPNNPASLFTFMADKNLVAIGDVNSGSYNDFKTGDYDAFKSFKDAKKVNITTGDKSLANQIPMSIETTHCIMRLESNIDDFIFISAITDRYAYFDSEVSSRELAQNFTASFNGGIFLNWFIPFCFEYYSQNLD